jgi:hypothetical protein
MLCHHQGLSRILASAARRIQHSRVSRVCVALVIPLFGSTVTSHVIDTPCHGTCHGTNQPDFVSSDWTTRPWGLGDLTETDGLRRTTVLARPVRLAS